MPEVVPFRRGLTHLTHLDSKVVPGGVTITPTDVLTYFRQAQDGDPRKLYAFYDEMVARDAHLDGEIGKATDDLTAALIEIGPPDSLVKRYGEDSAEVKAAQAVADVVSEALLAPETKIHNLVEALAWGFWKGLAAVEVIVEPGAGPDGYERFSSLRPIPAQRFCQGVVKGFMDERSLDWYLQTTDNPTSLVPVSDLGDSICLFTPDEHIPNLGRRGRLRRCLQPWTIRMFGIAWWSRFVELYGIPVRVGYYNDIDTQQRDRIAAILKNAGADGFMAVPNGTKIEFPGAVAAEGTPLHKELLEWAATEISKSISSASMTFSGENGSYARDAVHDQIALRRTQTRARLLSQVIRDRIVKPYVRRNFGDEAADIICPDVSLRVTGGVDRQALALTLLTMRQAGARIPKAWAYEQLEMPMPKDDEEYLGQEDDEAAAEAAQAQLEAAQRQELPPKGQRPPRKAIGASAEIPSGVESIEEWAGERAAPALKAMVEPYTRIINASLRRGLTPQELASRVLKEFGEEHGDPKLAATMTAVMAHAVLSGRNSVRTKR